MAEKELHEVVQQSAVDGPAHIRSGCGHMAAAAIEGCLCSPPAGMTATADLLCQTRGAAGTRLCGCFASQRRNTAEFGGR